MKSSIKCLYIILSIVIFAFPVISFAAKKQCVILLHGLTRSHSSMAQLAITLKKYNYIVVNEDYPSTAEPIMQLANEHIPPMIEECLKNNVDQIDFVTHSLGGIILQVYLQNHKIAKLGNIVMMSPPNHGSQVTDLLHDIWLYRFIAGPAGQELTTSADSTPNKIRLRAKYPIGVIAGTFDFIPFGDYLFHGKNDGAVSVSSAKITAMQDFIELPVSHPFMMDDSIVQLQILNFLKFGAFSPIIYVKHS